MVKVNAMASGLLLVKVNARASVLLPVKLNARAFGLLQAIGLYREFPIAAVLNFIT